MYEIYSDETGHEDFRGIGSISGPAVDLANLRRDLEDILARHNMSRVEWKDLSGDSRHERAARDFVVKTIDYAGRNRIRIDVLIWNIRDDRHSFQGVDHAKNLEFMYYKLLRLVKQRWSHVTEPWAFLPDEKSGVDWRGIIEILENTNLHKRRQPHPELFALLPEFRFPRISHHEQLQSDAEPLVQAIDLIAGASRFSHEKGELIFASLFEDENQLDLFGAAPAARLTSNGERSKGRFVQTLYDTCSSHKLHVSFRTKRRLWSRDQSRSVNFWTYEPAGHLDKAPARESRKQSA